MRMAMMMIRIKIPLVIGLTLVGPPDRPVPTPGLFDISTMAPTISSTQSETYTTSPTIAAGSGLRRDQKYRHQKITPTPSTGQKNRGRLITILAGVGAALNTARRIPPTTV